MDYICVVCNKQVIGPASISEGGILTCQKCENEHRTQEVLRLGYKKFTCLDEKAIESLVQNTYIGERILKEIRDKKSFIFFNRKGFHELTNDMKEEDIVKIITDGFDESDWPLMVRYQNKFHMVILEPFGNVAIHFRKY